MTGLEIGQGSTRSLPRLRMNVYRKIGVVVCYFVAMNGIQPLQLVADEPPGINIVSQEIVESSGLANSLREPEIFWTHNDSGGDPKLYAFNTKGEVTGSVFLEGAAAVDWEDMASFVDGQRKRLVVGDIGDNDAKRNSISLYFLDEPNPREHTRTRSFARVTLRYPDGPRDCEAIAVDWKRREILMISKSFLPVATCYSLPLPTEGTDRDAVQVLTHRGTLAVPLVTAMDIDPQTGDIMVANYFQCFRYRRESDESAYAWISRVPEVTNLPKLKQIEAIAFDRDGDVWVTSEGVPGKLARVPMVLAKDVEVQD